MLRPLARRARAGEDPGALAEELYERGVHDWARARAQAMAGGLPAHADRNELLSQALRLAWEACLRIDWTRVESWPALLELKVGHARREAARAEDWLSRRERVHRKRYQRALASLEQQAGRPPTAAERQAAAEAVAPASNRVDWARELMAAKHPSTVAALPDRPGAADVADEVEDRIMQAVRARGLRAVAGRAGGRGPAPGPGPAPLERRRLPGRPGPSAAPRACLPSRLARRVEPYTPMLVGLLVED